jgi:hypothetical protein
MQWAVDWRQTVQFVNRNNDDYLNKFDSLIWNDVHVIGNKIFSWNGHAYLWVDSSKSC